MYKQLISKIKPLLKSLFAIGLVLTLALGNADGALAAAAEDASAAALLELRRAVTHLRAAPTRPREAVIILTEAMVADLVAASVSRSCCRFLALGAGLVACSRF